MFEEFKMKNSPGDKEVFVMKEGEENSQNSQKCQSTLPLAAKVLNDVDYAIMMADEVEACYSATK